MRERRQTHEACWEWILTMRCRFGGAGGGPGGNPKAALGGMGLLIAGTGAIWLFNNALFNGMQHPQYYLEEQRLKEDRS